MRRIDRAVDTLGITIRTENVNGMPEKLNRKRTSQYFEEYNER
jgi:hypothetical protein